MTTEHLVWTHTCYTISSKSDKKCRRQIWHQTSL